MTERSVLSRRPIVAQMLVRHGVLEKSDLGDGTEPFLLDEVYRWATDDLSVDQRIKLLEDSPVTAPFPRIWAEFRLPDVPDCFVGALIVSTKRGLDATVYLARRGATGRRAGTVCVELDEEGRVASDFRFNLDTMPDSIAQNYPPDDGALYASDTRRIIINGLWGGMSAFVLLNAKNITAPRHFPNRAMRRQRARDSNGGDPFMCYRMLRIDAPHDQKRSRGRKNIESCWLTAQHIVRGHWAVYTKENPMFGRVGDDRYVGRFWVVPHLKGDQSKGVIAKGYVVEPGNEVVACSR